MRDQRRSPLRVVRTERGSAPDREDEAARQQAYWERVQALRHERDRLRAG